MGKIALKPRPLSGRFFPGRMEGMKDGSASAIAPFLTEGEGVMRHLNRPNTATDAVGDAHKREMIGGMRDPLSVDPESEFATSTCSLPKSWGFAQPCPNA